MNRSEEEDLAMIRETRGGAEAVAKQLRDAALSKAGKDRARAASAL
jgi:hypothetical protein